KVVERAHGERCAFFRAGSANVGREREGPVLRHDPKYKGIRFASKSLLDWIHQREIRRSRRARRAERNRRIAEELGTGRQSLNAISPCSTDQARVRYLWIERRSWIDSGEEGVGFAPQLA